MSSQSDKRLHVTAGEASCVCLDSASPIPCAARLTLVLAGPRTLRGALAERDVDTARIEARFTCRTAGSYALHVEDADSGHILLDERIVVDPGPLHIGSCALLANIGRTSRTFRMQAKDAHGNVHTKGGELLLAAINQRSCAVLDEQDGTYAISLPVDQPHGPWSLRVWRRHREKNESEAQFPVYVPKAKSWPASCQLVGQPLGIAGKPLELGLQLLDASGADCSAGDVASVEVRASLGGMRMLLRATAATSAASAATSVATAANSVATGNPRAVTSSTSRRASRNPRLT